MYLEYISGTVVEYFSARIPRGYTPFAYIR